MTDTPTPHRATPGQWTRIESIVNPQPATFSCLIELRDRLTAAEQRISELQALHNTGVDWQQDQDGRLAALEAQPPRRLALLTAELHGRVDGLHVSLEHALRRITELEQLHQAVVDLNERFSLEPLVARVEALENAADGVLWPEREPQRFIPGPQQVAECGGPCETEGPEACDCQPKPTAHDFTADEPHTLHTIALQMVDSLGRSFNLLPEILDTLRRAIREPMGQPAPTVKDSSTVAFSGSELVDRVMLRLAKSPSNGRTLRGDAIVAIDEVAAWLMERDHGIYSAAKLRQEAERAIVAVLEGRDA